MKKIYYRILAAWKALTACDVIIVTFSKGLKECEVMTATYQTAVDTLADQIPELASTARKIDAACSGNNEVVRYEEVGFWPSTN